MILGFAATCVIAGSTPALLLPHLNLALKTNTCRPPAGKLVSDAGIVAGLAGWVAVAAAALLPTQPASPRLLRTLGISAAAYLLAGGSIKHGDTPLVGAMKEGWHRARPSEVLHTFAFPRCVGCVCRWADCLDACLPASVDISR